MALQLRINDARFLAAMRIASDDLAKNSKKELDKEGFKFITRLQKEGFNFSGGRLHTRTGALTKSLRHRTEGSTLNDIEIRLLLGDQATKAYAAVQEFGSPPGGIRPRGRFLAIPLDAAKNPSGVPRGGPRDFPNLQYIPLRSGNALLVETNGGTTFVPWFLLHQGPIHIKPRLGMRKQFRRDKEQWANAIDRAATKALENIGRKTS